MKLDKTAPVTVSDVPAGWSKEDVAVQLTATDTLVSGIAKTFYSINGSAYAEGNSITVNNEGINKISYYSVDQAGNQEAAHTVNMKIDKTAPVTVSDAPAGWSKEDVAVQLTATDTLSGTARTYYTVNDSDYAEGNSITVNNEGISKISYYSVDQAGNKEAAQTIDVKIDKTAPVVTMNLKEEVKAGTTLQLAYSATDSLSGVAFEKMTVSGPEYDGRSAVFYKWQRVCIGQAGSLYRHGHRY